MERQLLINCIEFVQIKEPLNETQLNQISTPADGKVIVKGILQRKSSENQNGRIYPDDVLMREVGKYDENFVKQKRAMGELDHPESTVVNLKNVSHNVKKMWWSGDNLLGEVEILTTPSGNILKELFRCGITIGISSRGLGSVKQLKEGTVEVQDDFELIAFDFVSNPSTVGAFMHPEIGSNLNESKELVYNNVTNQWQDVDNLIYEILNEIK